MERVGSNWMETLPSELLEHIFCFLSGNALCHVRLVCHRWRDIVNGCWALSARFAIVLKRDVRKENYYIRTDFRPPPLIRVSSFKFKNWGIEFVDGWWPNFGLKLTQLALNLCNVRMEVLMAMLKQTPTLTSLHLKSVFFRGGNAFGPPDFRLDRMKQLRMEQLFFEEITIADVLGAFVVAFPLLVEFRLFYPARLEVLKWVIESLQGTLQLLDVVIWQARDMTIEENLMQGPPDTLLPDLCKLDRLRLKRISLDVCLPFVVEDWIRLFKAQPGIEELILQLFHSMILIEIATITPTIKALTLYPEQTLDMFALNGFKQLEFLEIAACSNVFSSLDTGDFEGVVNPQLKTLQLFSLDLTCILEYLRQCPLVEHILLKRCRLEEEVIIAPTTYVNLRSLNISDCAIDKTVLLFIFDCSPGLDHVLLIRTTSVDDQVIRMLCERATRLRKLELKELRNVTDCAGEHIILYARQLEEMRLHGTTFTKPMLERLQHCRNIRVVYSLPREKVA